MPPRFPRLVCRDPDDQMFIDLALSLGALYLVAWVVFASASPGTYAKFQAFNASIVGRIVLGGWLFCLFYHLCNGIRHLFWDAGIGFAIKDAERASWIVIGVAFLAVLVVRGMTGQGLGRVYVKHERVSLAPVEEKAAGGGGPGVLYMGQGVALVRRDKPAPS